MDVAWEAPQKGAVNLDNKFDEYMSKLSQENPRLAGYNYEKKLVVNPKTTRVNTVLI